MVKALNNLKINKENMDFEQKKKIDVLTFNQVNFTVYDVGGHGPNVSYVTMYVVTYGVS